MFTYSDEKLIKFNTQNSYITSPLLRKFWFVLLKLVVFLDSSSKYPQKINIFSSFSPKNFFQILSSDFSILESENKMPLKKFHRNLMIFGNRNRIKTEFIQKNSKIFSEVKIFVFKIKLFRRSILGTVNHSYQGTWMKKEKINVCSTDAIH